MKNKFNFKKYAPFIILIIGCISYTFSSGRLNVAVFAWIWPFCVLYFLHSGVKKRWFIVMALSLIILSGLKWYPMIDADEIIVNLAVAWLLAIIKAIPFAVDYFLRNKIKGFKSTFLFPLTYVTVELIISFLPISNIGSIAVTQYSFLPFMQSASLFGALFLTFVITWFPSVLLYIIKRIQQKEKFIVPAAIYTSLFLAMVIFGTIRVCTVPAQDTYLVALGFIDYKSGETNIEEKIKVAKQKNADIIVFTEEAAFVNYQVEDEFKNRIASYASENNIFVSIGVGFYDSDKIKLNTNCTILFDNHGNEVFTYVKHHLVPFGESSYTISGDGRIPNATVTLPSGKEVKLSSVICMDAEFSLYVRNGVDKDTGSFLVPTWDWPAINNYHPYSCSLRAIENGFSLIRSTKDGVSTICDQYGRITTYSNDKDNKDYKVLFGEATISPVFTLYKYVGIVTDWLFPSALVILITASLVFNYKQEKLLVDKEE